MKTQAIFFILSLIFSNLTFAQSKQVLSDWETTQLRFANSLPDLVKDDECLKSEVFFLACLNTINKSLDILDSKNIHFALPDPSAEGGFEIKAYPLDENIPEKYKVYKTSVITFYQDYMNQKHIMRPIPFAVKTAELSQKLTGIENESYLTSVVINHYLSTAYDPHTYIKPLAQHLREMQPGGERLAYGLVFGIEELDGEKIVVINNVLKESPAEAAGLESGDIILSVNGIKDPKTIQEIIYKQSQGLFELDGPKGSRTLTLVKGQVKNNPVEKKLITSIDGKIYGYIKLNDFMSPIGCRDIMAAGMEFKKKIQGLVLDLRFNPGGRVDEAICITELFVPFGAKTFVFEDLHSKKITTKKKTDFFKNLFTKMPTVVLINGASASASEVVSVYLQAYRKAFILGERSFGKGTMQNVGPISETLAKGSTVAKYYGPHGVSPQLQGVIPDIEVYPRYKQVRPSSIEREEDLYENAIVNKPIPMPQMQGRLVEVEKIKTCLSEENAIEQEIVNLDRFKQIVFDQQLSAAKATLDCVHKLGIEIFHNKNIPVVTR